jgi:hypothetical protein
MLKRFSTLILILISATDAHAVSFSGNPIFSRLAMDRVQPTIAPSQSYLNTWDQGGILHVGGGVTNWTGSDVGAEINSAMGALPATGGVVVLDPGVYSYSTTVNVTKPVLIEGAGGVSTQLNYTGIGDAIVMHCGVTAPYLSCGIIGIDLTGNANPNAVGIHNIDTTGPVYDDDIVQGFTGTNGIGMWWDNQVLFSERVTLRKLSIYNNTYGWKYSNSNSANPANSVSFAYWRVSEVHFQIGAGQTGIIANAVGAVGGNPSISLNDDELDFDANLTDPTATLAALTNHASIFNVTLNVYAECTTCGSNATGFNIDSSSVVSGNGIVLATGITNPTGAGAYSVQPFSSNYTGTLGSSLVFALSPTLLTPSIGGGAGINRISTGAGLSLNSAFTSIRAGTCQEQTLTLIGAATTGTAMVNPTATPGANFRWAAWVSSTNTISVRLCAGTTATPKSVTWNVVVIQ